LVTATEAAARRRRVAGPAADDTTSIHSAGTPDTPLMTCS
jgi:hypothetical protein